MLAGLGASTALAVAERQGAALQARFAARRDNAADADQLREAAGRITDVEALLKDRRALRLVLEAFQLETEIDKRAIIRRVLTEDPADERSFVNRMADPRWKAFAEAMAPRRTTAISGEALAAQTPEQVRGLALNRIAGLDFLQIGALTAEQVAALDARQVAAIAPEAISGMDAADVTALSGDQVAALTPAQMRALLIWQVEAIEPADLARLGEAQLRALTPAQIGSLGSDQLAALRPEQLAAFSRQQADALGESQRAALSDAGRAILAAAPFRPEEEVAAAPPAPLADAALVERLIADAMRNRYEKAMGEANQGMREALYFRRMAGSVTSIAQLMSDRALTEVVRGALGLPQSFGLLQFEQQRDLLTRRVDLSKFQDPAEVARMARRYVAQLQPSAPAAPGLAALFDGSGSANAIAGLAGARISFSA